MATTAVGDRYVLDELRRRGWALGGEQSGHIIDLGFGPSGDGIASALLTLEALGERDLLERDAMEKLPQRLVNIRADDRAALTPRWRPARGRGDRARADRRSTGRGRVLVRASGTEPLVRVMVEAPSPSTRPMRLRAPAGGRGEGAGVGGWKAAVQGWPTQALKSRVSFCGAQDADRRCGSTP